MNKNNNDVRITSWIVKCTHFFLLVFYIFKFVWSLTVNLWFRSWYFKMIPVWGMIFSFLVATKSLFPHVVPIDIRIVKGSYYITTHW